ncbi:MAG: bifunctional DNA-binding transcriptional regulator/O6-methylguanine-DNA methyltransferase Ada [Acetobacteraceae bacterium]
MNAISPPSFGTDASRWAAIRGRDPEADGHFLYAVATTGVYCRPSCAARPARPENVSFHPDRVSAERAGFRPCKRCKPDQPPRAEREATLVAAACRAIEAAEDGPSLESLATAAGLSPFHFHRLFRRVAGVTPKAYAAAHRARRVQDSLQRGESVTGAIYEAGFSSSGRFYAAADGMLGMRPSTYRAGGPGELIRHAVGQSALGLVLVAATERGICAILLGDEAAVLEADLRARFRRARLEPAGPALSAWVAQVVAFVETPQASLALPLDIQGTAFQRRVWEILQSIPPGETLSYTQVAARLGSERAVRAVAGACAANPIAVAVPCHRVVAADGGLAGYRWGLARKAALLRQERATRR